MSVPEFLLDKRTVERYLQKGLVTAEQLEAAKANLPDRESNAELVSESEEAAAEGEPAPATEGG
jgi:hypothetical protein